MPSWIETSPEQLRASGVTPEQFNKMYRPAGLYEIDRKPGIWLRVGSVQKRPFVKRA